MKKQMFKINIFSLLEGTETRGGDAAAGRKIQLEEGWITNLHDRKHALMLSSSFLG